MYLLGSKLWRRLKLKCVMFGSDGANMNPKRRGEKGLGFGELVSEGGSNENGN